jgi:hypothetical protein
MLPTKIYTVTIAANNSLRLLVQGEFFKIMAATGGVNVTADFGTLEGLIFGQGLENTPFTYLLLTDVSGASNTIKILVGDQNFVDGLTGNMGILSNKVAQSSSFVNVNATVTNASAQLLAANTNRQYLIIQNNDPSGNIYVNFGNAATAANGIKIAAGGAYELVGVISTQQIFAIGDIASNANVVTVQG